MFCWVCCNVDRSGVLSVYSFYLCFSIYFFYHVSLVFSVLGILCHPTRSKVVTTKCVFLGMACTWDSAGVSDMSSPRHLVPKLLASSPGSISSISKYLFYYFYDFCNQGCWWCALIKVDDGPRKNCDCISSVHSRVPLWWSPGWYAPSGNLLHKDGSTISVAGTMW